jgi:hypothetical protein
MAYPHANGVPNFNDALPSTTIRFFLSSTFVAFQAERDVLHLAA